MGFNWNSWGDSGDGVADFSWNFEKTFTTNVTLNVHKNIDVDVDIDGNVAKAGAVALAEGEDSYAKTFTGTVASDFFDFSGAFSKSISVADIA